MMTRCEPLCHNHNHRPLEWLTWPEVDRGVDVGRFAAPHPGVRVAVGRVQDNVGAQVGPGQVSQEVHVDDVALARLEPVRTVFVLQLEQKRGT